MAMTAALERFLISFGNWLRPWQSPSRNASTASMSGSETDSTPVAEVVGAQAGGAHPLTIEPGGVPLLHGALLFHDHDHNFTSESLMGR
jgi:hypothetical protein